MKHLKNFFSPSEFTGKHMFAVMCLFFGTIISVNLVLAYQANMTWTGLVVKNSYVASQTFDKETSERRQQLDLGWKAETSYADGWFEVSLVDKAGKGISNVQTMVKLGRPAHENDDQKVILSETAKGRYVSETELASGIWQADITVANPTGTVWTRSIRFVVKG
jgi:nitrogen fixation protein FixH